MRRSSSCPCLRRRTPVLRDPALGDVELGQHLDPRDQHGRQAHRVARAVAQDAVDAEAHADVLHRGLDVDVGGAVLDGVGQQAIDGLHGRAGLAGLAQLGQLAGGEVVLGRGQVLEVRGVGGQVDPVERRVELRGRHHDGPDRLAEQRADVIDGGELRGIDDGDVDLGTVGDQGQDAHAARRVLGHAGDEAAVEVEVGDLRAGQAEVAGDALDPLLLGERSAGDQEPAGQAARVGSGRRAGERLGLGGREAPLGDERARDLETDDIERRGQARRGNFRGRPRRCGWRPVRAHRFSSTAIAKRRSMSA